MSESRVYLRGAIGMFEAPELRSDLDAAMAAGDDLFVDCSELTYIDSTGIRALLEAHQTLEASGHRMLIANMNDSTRRVFDILGLTDVLRFHRGPSDDAS
jgi:anti-sigma B factor antagonist